MGACTVTKVKELGQWPWAAGKRAKLVKITLSASYATGGDTLSNLVDFGFKRVDNILVITGVSNISGFTSVVPSTGGYKYTIGGTSTAPTVVVTAGGGSPAEVSAATNLSAQNFHAIVVGDGG